MQGGLEGGVGEIEIVTDERRRLVEVLPGLASGGGSWGIHGWFYLLWRPRRTIFVPLGIR